MKNLEEIIKQNEKKKRRLAEKIKEQNAQVIETWDLKKGKKDD